MVAAPGPELARRQQHGSAWRAIGVTGMKEQSAVYGPPCSPAIDDGGCGQRVRLSSNPSIQRSSPWTLGGTAKRLLHGGREFSRSSQRAGEVAGHVRHLHVTRPDVRNDVDLTRQVGPTCPARTHEVSWLRDALKEAIKRDDPVEIEALVHRGAPLSVSYHHKSQARFVNPIDWAALELRFQAATRLAELGQPLQAARHTVFAVSRAAKHGEVGLLRLLLSSGDVASLLQRRGKEVESALHGAVQAGKVQCASLLLGYGAWQLEECRDEVLRLALTKRILCVAEAAGVGLEDAQALVAAPSLDHQPSATALQLNFAEAFFDLGASALPCQSDTENKLCNVADVMLGAAQVDEGGKANVAEVVTTELDA